MQAPELSGKEKLEEVGRLVDQLEQDLSEKKLLSSQKVKALLALRQYGTKPENADPIYSQRGINVLSKYGLEGETSDIRRAALRCIANALLLNSDMRQIFVDTGYGPKLVERLRTDNSEDEMIVSRILFLTTYDTNMDFDALIRKHSLGDHINYQIARHAKLIQKSGGKKYSQIDELALSDTLKLVFNIAKLYADLADTFTPSIPHLFKIINRIDIPEKPLDGLIGYIVNALSTLDLEEKPGRFESSPLFPKLNQQNSNVDKLINILDVAVSVYSPEDLEAKAVPLLHLLITMYELAPDGPKKYMQWLLLPEENDRSVPIGRSDTLASKLLRLSTSHNMHLKTAISELMFVLSGKNAENLTKNIGYGFAAGFLASRGLEIPKNAGEAYADGSGGFDPEVNPITGQRWDAEPRDEGPPMSKEEKEREAERLFVLFERARQNGFIREHPVAQAVREGRIQELPDSDDDDSD
ncbi:hypothetical protein VTN31DRAFT_2949 [Thermomyces dupontii]|uniref:uncharacterized protein n=1 Tax=Talaromyces thermophilus TaxID=28565 RepID=UPI003743DEAC